VRKRSCWSNSSARSVGPGWLQHMISQLGYAIEDQGREHLLEKFGVLWVLEVLEVAEVGHEVWLVDDFLLG
jgi:hypothetical protein